MWFMLFCLWFRRPPIHTGTDTLVPYTTLFQALRRRERPRTARPSRSKRRRTAPPIRAERCRRPPRDAVRRSDAAEGRVRRQELSGPSAMRRRSRQRRAPTRRRPPATTSAWRTAPPPPCPGDTAAVTDRKSIAEGTGGTRRNTHGG